MEVTAALILDNENDISKVQEGLNALNKSGSLGNIPWTARNWGPEGRSPNSFQGECVFHCHCQCNCRC